MSTNNQCTSAPQFANDDHVNSLKKGWWLCLLFTKCAPNVITAADWTQWDSVVLTIVKVYATTITFKLSFPSFFILFMSDHEIIVYIIVWNKLHLMTYIQLLSSNIDKKSTRTHCGYSCIGLKSRGRHVSIFGPCSKFLFVHAPQIK